MIVPGKGFIENCWINRYDEFIKDYGCINDPIVWCVSIHGQAHPNDLCQIVKPGGIDVQFRKLAEA